MNPPPPMICRWLCYSENRLKSDRSWKTKLFFVASCWKKQGRGKVRQLDKCKFSQRLESQHQEKTLLLRGAAIASLFTIHKIQVSLSNNVQAFHISVVVWQTTGSSAVFFYCSVFGFPMLIHEELLYNRFKYSIYHFPHTHSLSAFKRIQVFLFATIQMRNCAYPIKTCFFTERSS